MEAIVIILFIAVLGGLAWCGYKLREHILENYNYDIFSWKSIVLGCVAIALLVIACVVYNDAQTMTLNVAVPIVLAIIIYVAMFIMHLQKLNVNLAVLSILYQIMFSAVIVFVIILVILYFMGRSSKKRISKKVEVNY